MTLLGLTLALLHLSSSSICATAAVYSEARGESILGQQAVARVVFNRVRSPRWPNDVCTVVTQPHQFDGIARLHGTFPVDGRAWTVASGVVDLTASDADRVVRGCDAATYFVANGVRPSWTLKMKQVCVIDNHTFYKDSK